MGIGLANVTGGDKNNRRKTPKTLCFKVKLFMISCFG
jgi:hypothetical protein